MSKYTREDIVRMVREQDVEFIRMQFTDIFGQLKNVAITASQVEKAVNNEIMIDGSSIEGFVRIQESDQYLRPDLDSFTILPWRPQHGKVARLICDVYNPDGTPFVGDPRGVLKRVGRVTEGVKILYARELTANILQVFQGESFVVYCDDMHVVFSFYLLFFCS